MATTTSSLLWATSLVMLQFVCKNSHAIPADINGHGLYINERVANSKNENLKRFTAMFRIPENATLIVGNISKVLETLETIDTADVEKMIINLEDSSAIGRAYLNLTVLSRFSYLKELWIFGMQAKYWLTAQKYKVFWPIESLHIYCRLAYDISDVVLSQFFASFINLKVIDIKYSYGYADADTFSIIISALKNNPFEALAFNNLFINIFSNDMTRIKMNDTFAPLQNANVEFLDLRYNKIMQISQSINNVFPNLKVLDLSNNMLFIKGRSMGKLYYLIEILTLHKKIEMFIFDNQGNSEICHFTIEDAEKTILDGNIDDSKYGPVNIKNMRHTRSLANIFPGRDFIFENDDSTLAVCLNSRNYTLNNILFDRDAFCFLVGCVSASFDIDCKYYPMAIELLNTNCRGNIIFPVAPNLTELYFSNFNRIPNDLNRPFEYMYFGDKPICIKENKFRILDLSSNSVIAFFNGNLTLNIKGLENLKELNLNDIGTASNNIIDFASFKSFPNLEVLSLRGNNLILPRKLEMCESMPLLRELDLSYNQLKEIPDKLFKNCLRLERIDLSYNLFHALPAGIRNDLDTIQKNHRVHLDITENLLTCNCHVDSIASVEWLQKTKHSNIHVVGMQSFLCFGRDKREFLSSISLEQHKEDCYATDEIVAAVFATSGFFLLIFGACSGYKHRYRVITVIYRIKHFITCGYFLDDINYTFDVFLSYCSEDRSWVCEKLLPVLEDKHGINCCVHERDFPATGALCDVIRSYMDKSKVLIMMLSANSVKKEWPNYELTVANHLNLMKNRRVIYIKLGDLGNNVPTLVKRITSSKIYSEWPKCENEERAREREEKKFWDKIVASIHGDSVCCKFCISRPSIPVQDIDEVELPLVSQA